MLRGRVNRGYCVICERATLFVETGPYLRDDYRCVRCASIPRWRALIRTLGEVRPDWRQAEIYECAPGGAGSEKLRRECARYTWSHWFADREPGSVVDGVRCEDLERLTFADESFDLVVTQDVFEHIFRADRAFREVMRVLRPGGAHVFTVPVFQDRATRVRAEVDEAGHVTHLEPPDYHRDPASPEGSLVVREWGPDVVAFIREATACDTATHALPDRRLGLDGEMLDVFVTRKPGA